MSELTQENLLNWLRSRSRLLGWDGIVAMDRSKINGVLSQEYIERFNTQAYLEPVSGDINLGPSAKVFIHDFTLDRPRLSFENADLNDSKARLRMAVIGGNQVNLRKDVDHWYPQRLDRIGPLTGPQLLLNLRLPDVPGSVSGSGAILLDLSRSDDFSLTFSDQQDERELGGNFFKELFNRLPPEQRVWSLGQVEASSNDHIQAEAFRLRTQAKPWPKNVPTPLIGSDVEGDGALLVFIRMRGGRDGSLPDANSDFRYLIVDDRSEGSSATALYDSGRLLMVQLIGRLSKVFRDLGFRLNADSNGNYVSATAQHGHYFSPPHQFSVERSLWFPGWEEPLIPGQEPFLTYTVKLLAQTEGNGIVPIASGLGITIRNRKTVEIRLSLMIRQLVEMLDYADDYGLFSKSDFKDWDVNEVESPIAVAIDYRIVDRSGGVLELERFTVNGIDAAAETSASSSVQAIESLRQDGSVSGDPIEDLQKLMYGLIVAGIAQMVLNTISSMQYESFAGPLRDALAKDLPVADVAEPLVKETIRLAFGQSIHSDEVRIPNDIVAFGRVKPDGGRFLVTPLEPVISAGGTQRFAVEPADAEVTWSVEPLQGFASSVERIDDDGLYHAPGAEEFQGSFLRRRVIATHKYSGERSMVLVTIMQNSIDLSPLVEVCAPNAEVTLKGGSPGLGELQWSFITTKPGGRLLTTTGAQVTYKASPEQTGKAYSIDEVQVRNGSSGESRSVCLITRMAKKKPMPITLEEYGTEAGKDWVRLALRVNGQIQENVQWKVLNGPGDFIGGVYQANPDSDARFAVVEGRVEQKPWGWMEGFIILPLPLESATSTYQVLASDASRANARSARSATAWPVQITQLASES